MHHEFPRFAALTTLFGGFSVAALMVSPVHAQSVSELDQQPDRPLYRYEQKPEAIRLPFKGLEREADLSVLTRKNEEYDALGIRAGDMMVTPSVNLSADYNDNIFARGTNEIDDTIYTVAPKLTLNSDFVQHQLSAEFYAEDASYAENSSEDFLDYGAKLKGRYDLTGDTNIPVMAGYFHDHIRRSSPDGRAGLEPTEFDLFQAQTGLAHSGQTLAYSATGQYDSFTFDDVPALGGAIVNNADRDRDEVSGAVKFGFANEAIIVPFVYGTVRDVSYKQEFDDFGFARSSFNFGYGGGSLFNISQVLRFTVTGGMISREFDDPRFSNVHRPTYSLELVWEPTPMLSFQAEGERSIQETTLAGLAASVDDIVSATANYEFAPNLSFVAQGAYLEKKYEGLIDANLEQYLADLHVTYKLNRNAWASAGYQYTTQDASGSNQLTDFDRNLFSINLHLQI